MLCLGSAPKSLGSHLGGMFRSQLNLHQQHISTANVNQLGRRPGISKDTQLGLLVCFGSFFETPIYPSAALSEVLEEVEARVPP